MTTQTQPLSGRYLPGNGPFAVGQHVRYIGKTRVFHPVQRSVETGETGVVVHDFGYDYRYLILLDRRAGIRAFHQSGGGVIFDLRIGAYTEWEQV